MSDFSGSIGSISMDGSHHAGSDTADWMAYGAAHRQMEIEQDRRSQPVDLNSGARPTYVHPSPQVLQQRGRTILAAVGLVFSGLCGVAGGYSLASDRAIVGGVLVGLSGLALGGSVAAFCLRGSIWPVASELPV